MLDVVFYGVRGSTPCCCERTRGFGGNTSCVLVEIPDHDPILLDCGTGLRYLGQELAADPRRGGAPFRGTALVTHLHWDHVQGLPFFVPMLREGAALTLVGPEQVGASLANELRSFIRPPLFPVNLDDLPGEVTIREQSSGSFQLGSATVTIGLVPHSGNTNGYRIDVGNASVAYIPDHQQPELDSTTVADSVLELCAGVDLLIHDAQYDDDEFGMKSDWGHSTAGYALEVARQSGAKRLVLFHHDPSHDDEWIDASRSRTSEQGGKSPGGAIEVLAASEGMRLRSGG